MDEIQIRAHCTKCGFRSEVKMPRRRPIRNQPCPKCGQKTLEKDFA